MRSYQTTRKDEKHRAERVIGEKQQEKARRRRIFCSHSKKGESNNHSGVLGALRIGAIISNKRRLIQETGGTKENFLQLGSVLGSESGYIIH